MTKEEYDSNIGLYKTLSKEARRLLWGLIKFRSSYFFKYEKWKAIKLLCTILTIGFILQVFLLSKIDTQIIKLPGITKFVYVVDSSKNSNAFLRDIAKLESGGHYDVISTTGFLGKYQLGRVALNDIGLGGISNEDFITTPELQEIAMRMLLVKNKKYLQSYIGKFNSKKVAGIRICEASLLAAAHLTGVGSVMQFLDSGGTVDPLDGNGITTSSRLRKFEGYKVDL